MGGGGGGGGGGGNPGLKGPIDRPHFEENLCFSKFDSFDVRFIDVIVSQCWTANE